MGTQTTEDEFVTSLFELWEKELGKVSGKSKTAEAIRYSLTRREGLERFPTDGASRSTPTSSNGRSGPKQLREKTVYSAAARAVDEPGRRWPPLLQPCKMNGVDPLDCLSTTLT
ncbi:hypothetical protein NXT3_PB00353 (plasmid) [Sinorhizobium fredii]|uniref:Uncharacterized protein n=1 Tax=Rhizobium fredii TaxID=380 RepID=A0A2L0HBY1_RHIFR|nr:hypothetical protein NXT3_PB00353 [Sinorhizobium fredii]